MKLIGTAMAIVSVLALGTAGAAQSKSEIAVKDGKDIKISGCVERVGNEYKLTHAADKKQARADYVLVAEDHDLSKYFGQRVEISGTATDRGDGKVEVKTESKVRDRDGDERKVESKSEVSGDLAHLRYLGVKSIKTIAAVCQ